MNEVAQTRSVSSIDVLQAPFAGFPPSLFPLDLYLSGPETFRFPPFLWRHSFFSPPLAPIDGALKPTDHFKMHDPKSEGVLNQIIQASFWNGVTPKDIAEPGKPYQYFYYKKDPDSDIVAAKITGALDVPLDEAMEIVYSREQELNGKKPIVVLKRYGGEHPKDPVIGAPYYKYYQMLDAGMVYVHFVTQVYKTRIDEDTVVVWSENITPAIEPKVDLILEHERQLFRLGRRLGYPILTPRQVSSAYILERDPSNPEITRVSFVTQVEFGVFNIFAHMPAIMEGGGKKGFDGYASLVKPRLESSKPEKKKER